MNNICPPVLSRRDASFTSALSQLYFTSVDLLYDNDVINPSVTLSDFGSSLSLLDLVKANPLKAHRAPLTIAICASSLI